jgi:hypothetical protein
MTAAPAEALAAAFVRSRDMDAGLGERLDASPLTSPAEATEPPTKSLSAAPLSLKPVAPSSVERSMLAAKLAPEPLLCESAPWRRRSRRRSRRR